MTKAYNDLPLLFRFFLQLFFGWAIASIYRFCRYFENKKTNTLLFAFICIPFCWLFWFIDLITTVLSGKITIFVD